MLTPEQIQRLTLDADVRAVLRMPGSYAMALAVIRMLPTVPKHFDTNDWNALIRAIDERENRP